MHDIVYWGDTSPSFHSLQVYRLQKQIDSALTDLDSAISLSGGRGKAAEQAHTQRGLIRRLQGENEAALEDFKAAARLGSRFAQKQVVAMNPYAALCNQMLTEAFDKLKRGESLWIMFSFIIIMTVHVFELITVITIKFFCKSRHKNDYNWSPIAMA